MFEIYVTYFHNVFFFFLDTKRRKMPPNLKFKHLIFHSTTYNLCDLIDFNLQFGTRNFQNFRLKKSPFVFYEMQTLP